MAIFYHNKKSIAMLPQFLQRKKPSYCSERRPRSFKYRNLLLFPFISILGTAALYWIGRQYSVILTIAPATQAAPVNTDTISAHAATPILVTALDTAASATITPDPATQSDGALVNQSPQPLVQKQLLGEQINTTKPSNKTKAGTNKNDPKPFIELAEQFYDGNDLPPTSEQCQQAKRLAKQVLASQNRGVLELPSENSIRRSVAHQLFRQHRFQQAAAVFASIADDGTVVQRESSTFGLMLCYMAQYPTKKREAMALLDQIYNQKSNTYNKHVAAIKEAITAILQGLP
jgi:hypothetical protein